MADATSKLIDDLWRESDNAHENLYMVFRHLAKAVHTGQAGAASQSAAGVLLEGHIRSVVASGALKQARKAAAEGDDERAAELCEQAKQDIDEVDKHAKSARSQLKQDHPG